MFLVLALTLSISNCCPAVEQLRAQGLSDAAIERVAREHNVPEWIIRYAKRHCSAPK